MLQSVIDNIKGDRSKIEFVEVIAIIDANYNFTPTKFTNGETINEVGQNSGSCKIFSFAKLQNLTEDQTLACFGNYYRIDVLKNPEGNDHQNIRNFIKFGWAGVVFENEALVLKQ
jgi:hypothetical protein